MTQDELDRLDFKIALQNRVKAELGEDLYKIEHQTIRKTNKTAEGLIIKIKSSEIAPVIYPDELYEHYKMGVPVEKMVKAFLASYEEVKKDIPEFTKENLKRNLYSVVINKDMNEELLRTVPHRIVATNLAEVARYRVGKAPDKESSFLVTNQHCRYLHMMDDEILEIAHKNTENQEYRLHNLYQLTASMLGKDDLKDAFDEAYSDDGIMLLTNMKGVDGANVITSQRIMKEVSEKLNSSFYILPSSRQELIIVPDCYGIEPKYLTEMVREVNKTLDEKDFLSDNIYHYNVQKMMLNMVSDKQEHEMTLSETADIKHIMKH